MRREVWVSGRRGRLELYLLNHPQYVNALSTAIGLNRVAQGKRGKKENKTRRS